MNILPQMNPTASDQSAQQSNRNFRKSLEIFCWCALGIFFITPLFLINYYQDDRIFILISEFSNLSPFNSAVDEIQSWFKSGRFLPLSVFVRYVFFDVFSYESAWLYHLVILILSGGAFYTFLKLVRYYEFKGSTILFLLFFLALTQFRVTAPDSIIGYNGLVQITAIIVCSALIFFELYFQSKRISYFIFGILLAVTSILYYEISLIILAAPIFIYLYKFKEFSKQFSLYSLFYLSLVLTFIFFRMYLMKAYAEPELDLYPGTELGLDIKSVLSAFVFQVSGSLPLSYIAHLFERIFASHLVTIAILFGACTFIYIKRAKVALLDSKFVLFSIFIIFSAAIPVALSKHHASWVSFGYPYIPVFIQNLALAAMLAALVVNNGRVRAVLFLIIFASSVPNYVLFYELDKKDGPIRLVFDIFGLKEYQIKTKFNKTFIVDGDNFGVDLKVVQSKARSEMGEISYTKPAQSLYEKGAVSNVILLSKSNYKNMIAVMGRIDKAGNKIENPVYLSPSCACIEQIASEKNGIISYKTHRQTMIYAYTRSGYHSLDDKLSCSFNKNWYDTLMDKFVPRQ